MSLCALIYKNIKGINRFNDVVQIIEMVINCILCCHNGEGRCIECKQNRLPCLRKINGLIIVNATEIICTKVTQ